MHIFISLKVLLTKEKWQKSMLLFIGEIKHIFQCKWQVLLKYFPHLV